MKKIKRLISLIIVFSMTMSTCLTAVKADETDLLIAPRLDELYRLATSGAKQKDVDKLYQKIIKSSFQ